MSSSRSTARVHLLQLGPYRRLLIAFAVGVGVFFVPFGIRDPGVHWLSSWDAFVIATLIHCWITITRTEQRQIREKARQQDFGSKLIFIFTSLASCISMAAVIFMMRGGKQAGDLGPKLALSIFTVISAWMLLHTIFALHYAHTYYGDSRSRGKVEHEGGLKFPGEEQPDYWDFAYFSVVIGMTYQVSDVDITSRRMRRFALLHSLIEFAFYTIIIAFAINAISSLLQ